MEGLGGFVKPKDMWLGTASTLEFAAAPDRRAISDETEGAEMASIRPIYLAREMRVTLLPHWNFEIISSNGEKKPLGDDHTAVWQWQVRPKEQGGSFELSAQVEIFGGDASGGFRMLDAFTRRVPVQVRVGTWDGFLIAIGKARTAGELFGALFKTLETTLISLAALLAALAGVTAAVRNLRRKEQEGPAPAREGAARPKRQRPPRPAR